MENREAIEELKMLKRTVKEESDSDKAIDMAISALKKQEKKPAKAKFDKLYNKFVYFCPVCGEVTGNYDFCSECGQAIDYDNHEPYGAEEDNE